MFTRVEKPALTEPRLFSALHPELATWFANKFTHFSPGQLTTVPEILAGHSALLCSPTGTGKTLAAFLGVFDYLAKAHDRKELPAGLVAIYVSPLRALTYDLQKNLQSPLDELGWKHIRVASRSGDTTPKERAAQRRKPPHILVTTPESLTLLLSQPTWIAAFKTVRFLIIDELHALAENKRGSLLMASAERLEDVIATAHRSPTPSTPVSGSSSAFTLPSSPFTLQRIGLSATVAPLETVAEFLVGTDRPCRIIDIAPFKRAHIELFSPLRKNPYPPAGWGGARLHKELCTLLLQKRTTLIFTNTRSGAESIGLRLKQLLPDLAPQIEVHHASLDRAVRLEVEDRLKRGELRAVVCSTSLELGIDIGSIDTVVMVSAPKGVSRALQRIGRSGHSMKQTSHGVLFATNINDLVECTVTAQMMERRELEPVRLHADPLDVLAQHLVGLAIFSSVTPDEAFALLRRAQPFKELTREKFDRVLRYLEGGGVSLERNYRDVFGKIRLVDGQLTIPSPRTARDFYQNVGTIAASPMIQVRLGRRNLGQVEEMFMKGLRPGDTFVLNGRTVRLIETRLLTAKVAEAKNSLPTVPRWNANKMPLTSGIALEVARFRTELASRLPAPPANSPTSINLHASLAANVGRIESATDWLATGYSLSRANSEAIVRHFLLQSQISRVPTTGFFLIERYEERGLLHYFVHSLIGRSPNDALSRIIVWRVNQIVGGNARVTIDDYGFLLTVAPFQAIDLPTWKKLFVREGAEEALRSALSEADLVKWQFRGVAQTGLMVPRRVHGQERGARSLQWSAEIIFDVLRRHEPDHPLLEEAYAEATLRFLDTPRALQFLDDVHNVPWELVPTDRVSPFSFGIFVSKIKETMTLEDPETTIERLYHDRYGADLANVPSANDQ
ncbi:helicase [Nibricoccus aquaticus]|uniref:Helicase n=1 Tax=Nibricoccus aquaticus TaxID=2576891 RepID=A0A290QFY3_9BACT|nr:DEAD/DEAH box helicase [Nibricoccus aquaticus]ATC62792.1 helicase [Nibricoccus aquaticus]